MYDGLELFQSGRRLQNLMEVPGVAEGEINCQTHDSEFLIHFSFFFVAAGWTPFHLYKGSTERDRNLNQSKLNAVLKGLLDKVRNSIHATYFRMPIAVASSRGTGSGTAEVADPIDLSVITNRLRLNDFYRNRDMMKQDLLRMVSIITVIVLQSLVFTHEVRVQVLNAKQSLPAGSEEAVSGEELRKLILELFAEAAGVGVSGFQSSTAVTI